MVDSEKMIVWNFGLFRVAPPRRGLDRLFSPAIRGRLAKRQAEDVNSYSSQVDHGFSDGRLGAIAPGLPFVFASLTLPKRCGNNQPVISREPPNARFPLREGVLHG